MDLTSVKVKIGSSEIGVDPNLKYVQEAFSKYYYIDLIAILTTLNLSISTLDDEDIDNKLRNKFINPHANQKLIEFEKSMGKIGVVFTRQTHLILIEMAIKFGKRDNSQMINLFDIGFSVLVVNSFIALVENTVVEQKKAARLKKAKENPKKFRRYKTIDIDDYADHAFKQYLFNHNTQLRYSIPRSFLVYKGLSEAAKPHLKYIDIDSLISEKRKMNLLELSDVLIIVYSYFGDFKLQYFDSGRFIQKKLIFNGVVETKKVTFQNFLERISVDVDLYRPEIPNYTDLKSWFSYMYKFHDFRLCPLIKANTTDGVLYFCSDINFIISAFWDAPYNIVLTDYPVDQKLKEDFFGFLGDTFECYIQKIAAYAFKEKFKLKVLKNDIPLNDGVIEVENNWEVIIEAKAARPSMELASGLKPIEEVYDFEKLIRKGMKQLNKRIVEYREQGYNGRISPILITSGFVPLNSLIWSRFRSKLADLEIFKGTISDHPILLDVESWEVICSSNLKNNDFSRLIRKKLSSKNYIEMPPHDFLYSDYFVSREPEFEELLSLKSDLWKHSIRELFEKEPKLKDSGSTWKSIFGDLKL
jgi:hypothetical protein